MAGGGKSSQTQNTEFTDNRAVLGEGAILAKDGGTVTTSNYVLDSGAIGRAFDTTDQSLDQAFSFGREALTYSALATASALDNLQSTQKLTADAYLEAKGRGALTDKIIIGAIGAMALVAFMAVKGKA